MLVPAPVAELRALDRELAEAGPLDGAAVQRLGAPLAAAELVGAVEVVERPRPLVQAPSLRQARELAADPVRRSRALVQHMRLDPAPRALAHRLADLVTPNDRSWLEVLLEAAQAEHARIEDVLSRSRQREAARARHRAWWMLRELTTASFPDIGRVWGYDHTTIVHGVETHAERNGLAARPAQWVEPDPPEVDEPVVRSG